MRPIIETLSGTPTVLRTFRLPQGKCLDLEVNARNLCRNIPDVPIRVH